MKQKYTHYSSSLSCFTKRSLSRHLAKIGPVESVEATFVGKKHGAWYALVVRGTLGKLVLRGCSWGYRGEGPRATRDALLSLGVDQETADGHAFGINSTKPVQGEVNWKLSFNGERWTPLQPFETEQVNRSAEEFRQAAALA